MTAKAIELVWWIVGTFGVAGLVAFWFLAPRAASLTLQAVVKFFKLLLSYRIGCALIAAVLAGLVVDHWRHSYDDAQFAARTAAFEAAQDARDERIEKKTREKVLIEIASTAKTEVVVDTNVKEFRDALLPPVATGNPFLVGADAGKLCRIAGKTECGPSGDKGMPATRRAGSSARDRIKNRLPSIIRTGARPDQ